MAMIGRKNLAALARTWRRLAGRKRITLPRPREEANAKSGDSKNLSFKAEKGRFVVYTADSRRFALPLSFLDNDIFRELLRLAEEEFGLPGNRPLTVPFDSAFMDYLVLMIQRNVAGEILEKALLTCRFCSSCPNLPNLHVQEKGNNQQLVIKGF